MTALQHNVLQLENDLKQHKVGLVLKRMAVKHNYTQLKQKNKKIK